MSIEQHYVSTISYDEPPVTSHDRRESLNAAIFKYSWDDAKGIKDLNHNDGGPAWGPYITFYTYALVDAVAAERYYKKLLRGRGCKVK